MKNGEARTAGPWGEPLHKRTESERWSKSGHAIEAADTPGLLGRSVGTCRVPESMKGPDALQDGYTSLKEQGCSGTAKERGGF